ncbi:ATP-dependent helicase Lhr and Lhr-like helicase [Pseudomonas panipatensis]|uniref:ATP-dependent helicase Lhr and Lhr-like helicase n=1 Tax=Pseudomonas panipatensis TaxID=428992 RepID=A0A1G8GCU5_9PSED|nr:DEAD/DEAH box helicase [Pseudomonas panipatensis]SDH92167.1 ATP-dependent helicase Lhr and Lhr-like helicase [Pseudomonas panipatensis]SMP44167.1 ATP dependent helicase, Lhr family [Pseudomonas panipatensis]
MNRPVTPTRPRDPLADFHPAVAAWFRRHFRAPTPAQVQAWPSIRAGRSTLVAAPTGSGKTLTAFLSAIDGLVREGLDHAGELPDRTSVVYVSPLKALSNDIRINLEEPLAGIREELRRAGLPAVDIRTAVRTGDTSQGEREAMRRRPPHLLVTTPESLYVLLGSDSGRAMLAGARSVIVDEIHALAGSKRGSHLALSLERLQALCAEPLVRIGLSATQKPIEAVAAFLVGHGAAGATGCDIVDIGYSRARDLAIEVPPAPLEAVMSHEVWDSVYDRLAALAEAHRTTLVFVNTRRLAERITRHLGERLGIERVAAHHGSLSKEQRLGAEQRLKAGRLKVLVATASLELGIDIGEVELVCQIASPRSIAAFLQRVGRSGHSVGGTPKGRLFPTSRDELVECVALLDSVRRGELDALVIPRAPLDVLAQQIVAEVACREWHEEALFQLFSAAQPYAELPRERFEAVLRMLAEGYASRNGQRAAYLHRDGIHHLLRGRRGARLTAVTSGGTIPDAGDYSVLLEPQGLTVGTVNEDFAVESLAGDVFQLGNVSYRILRIEPGKVRVEDAQGQPPNIPFWLGEAPGRSDELSASVSRLRERLDALLAEGQGGAEPLAPAIAWLNAALGVDEAAARQMVEYLARARNALGVLPSQSALVLERFFDESGGMQLVIHSPYGSRVNRAWGLALRKRFCRTFNFELQAAATEDAIILSLSTSHSFPLDEVWRYLNAKNAEQVLLQALLDAPLFGVRWRWNATTALALPRFRGGRKVAPQLQRMRSEDLLAAVFPDQVACLENIVGERQIPDHPLVAQTLDDCLHQAMDCDAWLALLRRMENGAVRLYARDLPAPSALAAEVLSAAPYAFLDDAPLEERRTQAVQSRRWSDPECADDLGALDPEAIAAVRAEAWPEARDADEMHEALSGLGCIRLDEAAANLGWELLLGRLAKAGRATRLRTAAVELWVAAERLAQLLAIYPQARPTPALQLPATLGDGWSAEDALLELLRARLTGFGPRSQAQLADDLGLDAAAIAFALAGLEREGYVLRGRFSPGASEDEWCERHLLARIHRYTVRRLRREIEPVERADYLRFLFDWQRVAAGARVRGAEALAGVLSQLEGFQAAAGAWESDILPARVADYTSHWLDDLCRAGRLVWARLPGRGATRGRSGGGPLRSSPIVLVPRRQFSLWSTLGADSGDAQPSSKAQKVLAALTEQGALFFDELLGDTRLLRSELEGALGELVALGRVNADSFAGLRALLLPAAKRSRHDRRARTPLFGMADAGRWALLRRPTAMAEKGRPARLAPDVLEHVALTLLRRYGVVCWRVLAREADWLPPWRELLRIYHRLEARGEIRGGRFVAGLTGEQFALPEAVGLLREVRKRDKDGEWLVLSAVDPLNLSGSLLPGNKVPALAGNRVLYRDGVASGALIAGKAELWVELAAEDAARARELLIRR